LNAIFVIKHNKGCLVALNRNYKHLRGVNKNISLLLPPKKHKIFSTLTKTSTRCSQKLSNCSTRSSV